MNKIPRPPLSKYADETALVARLKETSQLSPSDRARISARGADLVRAIRGTGKPGLMEVFLAGVRPID